MNDKYWDRGVDRFDRPHPRLKRIASIVEGLSPSPHTLLDIGCGKATLRSLLPASLEYCGVDIAAADLATQDPEHFTNEDLDQTQLSFPDRTFDAVVCSGVFEYISSRERFLSFVASKVAPDGSLIFSFTNREHYRDLLPALVGRRHKYLDPHVNFMSIREVVSMLGEMGFHVRRYDVLAAALWQKSLTTRSFRSPWNLWNRQYLLLLSRSPARCKQSR